MVTSTSADSNFGIVKLIDFGWATKQQTTEPRTRKPGAVAILAPEAFSSSYDSKIDCFAAGAVFHMMLTGKKKFFMQIFKNNFFFILGNYPFESRNELRCYQPEIDESMQISQSVLELLFALLAKKASNRPSAAEAMDFECFDEYGIAEVQELAEN